MSVLTWMITAGGKFGSLPRLCDFLCRWAGHYYAQAELRGALEDIQPTKSFFAFHPHGCLSAGWTINGVFNAQFKHWAGKVNWLIDPSLRHKNPSFRVLCDGYQAEDRAIEAGDSATFKALMERGESVAFIPGGFQDAVAYAYGQERTVVRRRKGFIKYCLTHGYRLHPVYTFGESETYHAFTGLWELRMRAAESNVPMIAFWGWPLFPLFPRPESRILTYVGPGIDVPHIPAPSAADIDHWHGVYLEALRRLFEERRAEAGKPDAELQIL